MGQTSAHAIDMWLCAFMLSTALHFNNTQKVTLLLHLHEVFAGLHADNALPEQYVQANTMLLATVIIVLYLHPHSSSS